VSERPSISYTLTKRADSMTGNEINEFYSGHVVDEEGEIEIVVGRYRRLIESVACLHCRATENLS
jgi:hypothetical protein